MIALLAQLALAQGVGTPPVDVRTWRPPVDARDTLWADDASIGVDGFGGARVSLDYANGPLAVQHPGGTEPLVEHMMAVDVVGSFVARGIRFGVDLPLVPLATGPVVDGGFALGDAALDVKVPLADPDRVPLGVAVAGRLGLPTGTRDPLRNGGPSGELSAILDKGLPFGRVALNVGHRFTPPVDETVIAKQDALTWRAAVGIAPGQRAGGSLELAGRAIYAQLGDPGAAPVEGLVGGWVRVGDVVTLRAGVGTGLTSGLGAAAFRGISMVEFRPAGAQAGSTDMDGDGVVDVSDRCIDVAEDLDGYKDRDGCPDPDNDQDGVLDRVDACPDEAEDADDWKDTDGCVDPLTYAWISVTDPTGASIVGASMTLKGPSGELSGGSVIATELVPGKYTLVVSAPGWQVSESTVEVPEGGPFQQRIPFDTEAEMGQVSVEIVSGETAEPPSELTWTFVGVSEPMTVLDGKASATAPPGLYTVVFSAPGHAEQEQQVEVAKDGTASFSVELLPTTGLVTLVFRGEDGEPVEARWASEAGEDLEMEGGQSRLRTGRRRLRVYAKGFKPRIVDVDVVAGQEAMVELDAEVSAVRVSQAQIEIEDQVFFDTGTSGLTLQGRAVLLEVAALLAFTPEIWRLKVIGYADARGNRSYNEDLARARARSAVDYLIDAGVDAERLTLEGRVSDKDPSSMSDEELATERRVEFLIEKREP